MKRFSTCRVNQSKKERYFKKIQYLLIVVLVFSILFQLMVEKGFYKKAFGQTNGCDIVVDKKGTGDTATITQALQQASEGEKICVKYGIYYEDIRIQKAGITLTAFDTNKDPIIDGDTDGSGDGYFELPKGRDIALGGGRAYNFSELVAIENKDITFSHFTVRNSRGDAVSIHSENNPLTNIHVHDLLVQHSMVTNISVHGEGSNYGNDTTGTVIENNIFEYASQYPRYGGSNWPGTACMAGANDMVFKNNVIRYSWGDGLLVDCNWKRSNNVLIESNIIYDTKVSMLYIHASDNAIVRNNFVFTTPSNPTQETPNWACIHLQAQENESYRRGGVYGISGAEIYNNIFWGCRVMLGISAQAEASYLRDVDIYHNTFVSNGSIGGSWPANAQFTDVSIQTQANALLGKAESVTIANNLFAHAQEEDQIPVYVNGSSSGVSFKNNFWSKTPSNVSLSGDIGDSDPMLKGKDGTGKFPVFEEPPSITEIKEAYKWFEIKEKSPLIDKASSNFQLEEDFYYEKREGVADIGAVEFGSSGEPEPPKDPPKPPPEEKDLLFKYNVEEKVCAECSNCNKSEGVSCDLKEGGLKLIKGWNFITIGSSLKTTDTDWFTNQIELANPASTKFKFSQWDNLRKQYESVVYSEKGVWGFPLEMGGLKPLFVFVEKDVNVDPFPHPKGESNFEKDLSKGWNTLVFESGELGSRNKASVVLSEIFPNLVDFDYTKVYLSSFSKDKQSWDTFISDGNQYGTDFNVFAEEPYLVYVE